MHGLTFSGLEFSLKNVATPKVTPCLGPKLVKESSKSERGERVVIKPPC